MYTMLSNFPILTGVDCFSILTMIFFSKMVLIKFSVEENNPQLPTKIGSSFSCHLSLRELVNIMYLRILITNSK